MGSVLALVFPLISATDDLMALRSDIEESGSSNRAAKSANLDSSNAREISLAAALISASWNPGLG